MPKTPKRLFTADHIQDGVQTVAGLQQEALKIAPHMAGPMSRIPMQPQPEQEMLEGHCLQCKGKKQFAVEKETKMKNGTIMKQGKSDCGHMVSTFVSGAQDAG
jgi:hypothetical protein